MITQRAAARMRRDKRLFAVPGDVVKPAVGKMGDVDQHAEFVHMRDRVDAERLQSLLHDGVIPAVRIAERRLVVPCQRDQTHAAIVKRVDALHLSIDRNAAFQRQQRRDLPFRLVF